MRTEERLEQFRARPPTHNPFEDASPFEHKEIAPRFHLGRPCAHFSGRDRSRKIPTDIKPSVCATAVHKHSARWLQFGTVLYTAIDLFLIVAHRSLQHRVMSHAPCSGNVGSGKMSRPFGNPGNRYTIGTTKSVSNDADGVSARPRVFFGRQHIRGNPLVQGLPEPARKFVAPMSNLGMCVYSGRGRCARYDVLNNTLRQFGQQMRSQTDLNL